MNDSKLHALCVITEEYKAKSYTELSEIDNNGLKFYYEHENHTYWIEIFPNRELKDIIRIMVSIENDNSWLAKAIYFGKARDGKIIENDNMAF